MQKQVSVEHYDFLKYASEERMASYYRQVQEVLLTNAKSVRLIGGGDGIVVNILRMLQVQVEVFDYDAALQPDIVGNIIDIDEVLQKQDKRYDCIVCCQVLEHLEKQYFERVVCKLSKIYKGTCIISLPAAYGYIDMKLNLPKLHVRKGICFSYNFWRTYRFNGEHYWELGFRGHSIKQIENTLREYFYIERAYFVDNNKYHRFFVLKNRKSGIHEG